MATMIVKQEVEATPDVIAKSLIAFATATEPQQFKHGRGTFLYLDPGHLAALQGVPDMPVMVLTNPVGTMLGLICLYTQAGDIAMAFISDAQVTRVWNPD